MGTTPVRVLDVHSWLVVVTFMVVIVLVIHPIRIPLPIPFSRRRSHSSSHSTQPPATNTLAQELVDAASTITATGPKSSSNINSEDKTQKRTKYPYHFTLNIATAPVFGVLFLLATQSISGTSVRDGIVGSPANGVEPYAVMILFFSLAYICISIDLTGVLQYAAFWISKRGGGGGQRIFLYFFLFSNVMSGLTSNDVVILTMTPFLVYFSDAVDLITPVAFLMAEVQTANIGPFAVLAFFRDVWYDYNGKFKGLHGPQTTTDINRSHATGESESRVEQGLPEIAIPAQSIVHPLTILNSSDDESSCIGKSASSSIQEKVNDVSIHMPDNTTATDEKPGAASSPSFQAETHHGIQGMVARFERRWPLLYNIAIRMPWAILPFTFSMFIIVEGLSHAGWIAIFANWATKLIPNYIAATYAIGFISVALCNLFNNVPMTILVARILQHPNFVNSPLATPDVVKGCLFALIVGSNLGACTTLISSLAGLMWDSVLRSKNSGVGFWNFFRWNMGVMPVVILVALSVVVIEVKVIYN
ncbi:hypothetical protein BGZ65_011693 [Modicella reniformis]|uniref:Citrate transporter-like domain-containing protein n=1 Tax=Modicella reniformis TaxID=1440133 RepID=A0A9P6SV22_9FUNG|nr:hypothetical protein BGZ65_011693 [Modicella reniformis]